MQAFFIGTNSKYIHTALGIRYVTEYCREQGIVSVHRLEVTVNEPVLSVLTRITEQMAWKYIYGTGGLCWNWANCCERSCRIAF